MQSLDPRERIALIGETVRERFEAEKRVLSFDEYLALFVRHPWRHSRDAARYLRDCLDWFGTYEVERPGGPSKRWRLFDLGAAAADLGSRQQDLPAASAGSSAPVAGASARNPNPAGPSARAGADHLVGHERLQRELYRILSNFVREGRTNRLILLHGPNGSAKSTFAACLLRGLERYSEHEEGASYRFSWIFPRGSDGKAIGFGSRDVSLTPGESYAHLPDERIEVKVASELRENPLLLLPAADRRALIEDAYRAAGVQDSPPRSLLEGQLGAKNRQIFDALLTAYRGDLRRVLAHARIERYALSRRHRVGLVTIGPEMAVDAQERQVSVDRSLGALPASLGSVALFETVGELVDAAGGVLEFSDLLKRPLDAWRYLLLAIETGEVSLTHSMLSLDSVLIASSNELHLNAFKEHHEYRSFRGRLQLVRAPYLLDYPQEQAIYDAQIVPQVRVPVAPHATYVAALWAVLTRLRKPQAEGYENATLGKLASQLSPIEKAELYGTGRIPERLGADEANELRAGIERVRREPDTWANYEGLTGASPREIRNLLLDAAQDARYACFSPLAVLEHIRELCEGGDYDFLTERPEGGYHDHRAFIEVVRGRWLDRVEDEFRESSGLVEEARYSELFDRYVTHVSYWVKGERVYNRLTGGYEDPDPKLMASVEGMLEVESASAQAYRRDLISAVAAHAIDHPGAPVSYARVFPRQLAKLKEKTYASRKRQLAVIAQDVLTLLSATGATPSGVDEERRSRARATVERMRARFGYVEAACVDAVGELLRRRLAE